MTREMNKPDWHYKWIEHKSVIGTIYEKVERKPNPDIAEFFYATCERFKQCGKQ